MTDDGTTVRLDLAATTDDIAIARSVTAAMAARADLTIDQLEDARLAVDEAASQLVADSPSGGRLTIEFTARTGHLEVTVSAPSASGTEPSHDTFSWTVLSALTSGLAASVSGGISRMHWHIDRHVPVGA